MKKKEIYKKYKEKINLIIKFNKSYFEKSLPIVSDKEYDELKKEITNLEKEYNFLKLWNKSNSWMAILDWIEIKRKIIMGRVSWTFDKRKI